MKRSLIGILLPMLSVLMIESVSAGQTQSFLLAGPEKFQEAKMQGIAVDEEGIVAPRFMAIRVDGEAGAQVWSLEQAGDGSVYAATGSEGAIYRLKGDALSLFASTHEYELFTVALGSKGEIYASGAPNGTIVKIVSDGALETVFDTPEPIVWALLTDTAGNLYAATGEQGKLYKISPNGDARVLYRAEDRHLVSLAWSKDGTLLVGTEGRGLLLEVDPKSGEGKLLYDAPFGEVSPIAVGPAGEVYFGNSRTPMGGNDRDAGQDGNSKASGEDDPNGDSARLFLRTSDGAVRSIWRSADAVIQALLVAPGEGVYLGTGGPARLYHVDAKDRATLLWQPEEAQLLAITPRGGDLICGTGNPGRLYRLTERAEDLAWIQPLALNAGRNVRWGQASWEVLPGSGRWELRTRSGQTETPDSSWSPWSDPMPDADGSAVRSPIARYLQCEARFIGDDHGEGAARLQRIWIPYRGPNRAPKILGVRFSASDQGTNGESREPTAHVQDLGGGLRVQIQQGNVQTTENGGGTAPPWASAVRSIAWDVEDPDSDPLEFEIGLGREGENDFRVLKRHLEFPVFSLDTRSLPEGVYQVRIVASDAPGNPPNEQLEDTKVGRPFRVDHTAPIVVDLKGKQTESETLIIEGVARDDASPIRSLEVSVDGRAWRPSSSSDGILDSKQEAFKLEIDLDEGQAASWAAIRAVDAAGNEGIGRIWLTPRGR